MNDAANKKMLFLFVFVSLDYIFLVLSAPHTDTDGFNVPFKIYDQLYRDCVTEHKKKSELFDHIPDEIKTAAISNLDQGMKIGSIIKTTGKVMSSSLKKDVLMQLQCAYWNVKNDESFDTFNLLALSYVHYLVTHFATLLVSHTNVLVGDVQPVPEEIREAFFDVKITQLTVYLTIFRIYGPEFNAYEKLLGEGDTSKKELVTSKKELAGNAEWGLDELNKPLLKSEVLSKEQALIKSKGLSKEQADKVKEIIGGRNFIKVKAHENAFNRILKVAFPPKIPQPPMRLANLSVEDMNSLNDLFGTAFTGCYLPQPPIRNLTQAFKQIEKIKDLNLWGDVIEEDECLLTKVIKSLIRVTSEMDAAGTSAGAASTSTEVEKSG